MPTYTKPNLPAHPVLVAFLIDSGLKTLIKAAYTNNLSSTNAMTPTYAEFLLDAEKTLELKY